MAEKVGLMVFPEFVDTHTDELSVHGQRLEPSVLYMAPDLPGIEVEFLERNVSQEDIDLYLCSIYTRGWKQFKEFSQKVGRDKVIAGGYHPTAEPEATLPYAHKVVPGLCGDVESIIEAPEEGIHTRPFAPRKMRRDLVDMDKMHQVFPDVRPGMKTGSSNSSVGCPYDCDFCSTPKLSGRRLHASPLDVVQEDIEDLKEREVEVVFIRDESFATHPKFKDVVPLYGDADFSILYSFGTGHAMTEDKTRLLAENNWHSLCFGLEDVGVNYRKNLGLAEATRLCHEYGINITLSFIVNDDGKTKEEAAQNYQALYDAFVSIRPAQVCANFLMPFPGTGIWDKYKDRITEDDFDKYDSKTPILAPPELREWHQYMAVAVQLAYYHSKAYPREFECGDTQHLRFQELEERFDMADGKWERWFKPQK
ncbi:MAG: Radical domain protein [Candidatus Saccharibacteria bacterium]|nr:Radical domain protein [Candidatus Saccharibacteria bacterium]